MDSAGDAGGVPAARSSRRSAQGRQLRERGGRRHQVNVKLSEAEKTKLEARAALLGLSVPRLMVESALSSGGGSAASVAERHAVYRELAAVRRLVAALGNNVNQMARLANINGVLEPGTSAAMDAVTRVVLRLNAILEAMPVPPDRPKAKSKAGEGS